MGDSGGKYKKNKKATEELVELDIEYMKKIKELLQKEMSYNK